MAFTDWIADEQYEDISLEDSVTETTEENIEVTESSSHQKRINFYKTTTELKSLWEKESEFFYYFFNNDNIIKSISDKTSTNFISNPTNLYLSDEDIIIIEENGDVVIFSKGYLLIYGLDYIRKYIL